MNWSDACWMPYIVHGDIGVCHLPRGHRETCREANDAHLAIQTKALAKADEEFRRWLDGES